MKVAEIDAGPVVVTQVDLVRMDEDGAVEVVYGGMAAGATALLIRDELRRVAKGHRFEVVATTTTTERRILG